MGVLLLLTSRAVERAGLWKKKPKNLKVKSPNFKFFSVLFRKTLKIQNLDSHSQQKIVYFQSNLCLCYIVCTLHILALAGKRVYHVWDILREILSHNFVPGLRTLKPKNLKKTFNNLKT